MSTKSAVEVYASAARTATPTAVTLKTRRAKGLILIVDVSALASTPSVVVTINGIDPVSGNSYNILTSAAITATGTTAIRIGEAIASVANVSIGDLMPQDVLITFTHADTDSITYTATAVLVE